MRRLRHSREYSIRLASLLERLRDQAPGVLPDASPTNGLVLGFLVWESSLTRAAHAFRRLFERVVDVNELRLCLPEEIGAMIGERYPKARQRVARMRRVLADLHEREIRLSIDHLRDVPAVDATEYLVSLDGMLSYVAAFVRLHGLHHPVLPVDGILRDALVAQEIVDPLADPDVIGEWIADQIGPDDCASVHLALRRWAESRIGASPSE